MQELAEKSLPKTIDSYAGLLKKASSDLKMYQEQHPDNADFCIEINGKKFTERTEAADVIEKAIITCSTTDEPVKLGKYFGFELSIEKSQAHSNYFITGALCVAVLTGELRYTAAVSAANGIGNVRRIENLAGSTINQKIKQYSADLDKAKTDLAQARESMSTPFPRAEELAKMQARLVVVNNALSDNTDEPVPVLIEEEPVDTDPSKASSVIIAVPVPPAVNADSINMRPKLPDALPDPPKNPNFDNPFRKHIKKGR